MGSLSRLLYVDVSIRTSGFAWLMGFTAAVVSGYGVLGWQTALAVAVGLAGIVVVQAYEHALDVIHDRGGYSAFREEGMERDAARFLRRFPVLMLPLVAAIIVAWRPWLLFIAYAAARMGTLYVASHNEWYATFGFMLAAAAGYFSATNTPTIVLLIVMVIAGFIYKASLSMYRLDDYLDGELPSKEAVIQYYRNVFRYTLHYVPPLVALLLVAVNHPVGGWPWWAPLSWLAGFAAMARSIRGYRGHVVGQEAPIHWPIAGIMLPELYAAYSSGLLPLYIVMYAVLWIIVGVFWVSRHAMCNITGCPLNPLLLVKRPR